MKKIIIPIIIIIAIALMFFGIFKGDLGLIKAFGIFLCLDCIGIS